MWSEFILAVTAILLTLTVAWIYNNSFNKNLPPGLKLLPLICYLDRVKSPHIILAQLKQQYGDIFTISLGFERLVILSSYDLVNEAYVKQANIFSERPAIPRELLTFEFQTGMMASVGAPRIEMRHFTLTTLRNFGMGKSAMEPNILDEIDYLIEEIKKFKGKPAYLHDLLAKSSLNAICRITVGKRMAYEDENFQELLHLAEKYIDSTGLSQWALLLPPFMKVLFRLDICVYTGSMLYKKIFEEVQKHAMNDAVSRESFIDVWRNEANKPNANLEIYNDKKLTQIVTELFLAGSDTTSTSIEWYLLYLIKYPTVQEKMQLEIDNIIGRDRAPSMIDIKRMPYTEATLIELSRMSTISPFGSILSASGDTTLNGYFIPKDTTILPNMWALSHDPDIYPEPDKFKPERFLTGDNQVIKPKELIPFSIGKRQCPGEALARMQLFLYMTTLLQQFTFTMESEVSLSSQFGIVLHPPLQKICANVRKFIQK